MNTHVREQENCVSPQLTAFLALTPALRVLLEAAVEDALNFAESMTLFLDEIDGDPDREEHDQAEESDPLEADGDESEPSLGSLGSAYGSHQGYWASGGSDDREEEHDGREPDCDRELDPAEAGIGDRDGLHEQWGL